MTNKAETYALIKLLTFAPIVLLVFYTDIPGWIRELTSSQSPLLGYLVGATTLFGYGVFLKRRIIGSYLEFRNSSLVLGLLALAASATLYFVGSAIFDKTTLHFESLLCLLIGYLLLRFDRLLSRALVPLFAIVGISFTVSLFSTIIGPELGSIYVALIMLGIFSLFVVADRRCTIIPLIITGLELASWFVPSSLGIRILIVALIPASILVSTVPNALREKIQLINNSSDPVCDHHMSSPDFSGFCIKCGRRVGSNGQKLSSNFLGLTVLIVILIALLAVQVPVVSITGGVPSSNVYKYTGVSTTNVPYTPSGWLANSSTRLNLQGDVYATRIVYVPAFHPEVSNYTLVYALSDQTVNEGPVNGSQLAGWNLTSDTITSLAPFNGHLAIYQAGSKLMLDYSGTITSMYLNGSKFVTLTLGVSFIRVFTGTPQANASASFVNDLSSFFMPAYKTLSYYATYVGFLYQVTKGIDGLYPYLLIVSVGALFGWIAYAANLFDYSVDTLTTRVSDLDGNDWRLFEKLSMVAQKERTTIEIARAVDATDLNLEQLSDNLERLVRYRIIKNVLSERGPELLLTWKIVI
jgi:hypothetical protein